MKNSATMTPRRSSAIRFVLLLLAAFALLACAAPAPSASAPGSAASTTTAPVDAGALLAQAAANLEGVTSLTFRQSVTATSAQVRQVSVTDCRIAVRDRAFCAVSIDQTFGTQTSTQAFDTLMISEAITESADAQTDAVQSWVRLADGEWQQASGIGATLSGMPAGDFRAATVVRFARDAVVAEQTTLDGEPVYRIEYAIDPASYIDAAGSGFATNFSGPTDRLRGSGTAYITEEGSFLRRQDAEITLPVQGTEMQLEVRIDYAWNVPVEFPDVASGPESGTE